MQQTQKPFAQAAEENKQVILDVLAPLLAKACSVLEIGSGTGQHAVFFASVMSHLVWQTSDLVPSHAGIRLWIEKGGLANVRAPLELDVTADWPASSYDAVFSANTAHIMSKRQTEAMIRGVAGVLAPGGAFALYGPFNYGGRYTSESNARFDQWLKARDPQSGIKDFDDLDAVARGHGLEIYHDFSMPANNRILVWRRCPQIPGRE